LLSVCRGTPERALQKLSRELLSPSGLRAGKSCLAAFGTPRPAPTRPSAAAAAAANTGSARPGPAPPRPVPEAPRAPALHHTPANRTLTSPRGPALARGIQEAPALQSARLALFPTPHRTGPTHPTGGNRPATTPPLTACHPRAAPGPPENLGPSAALCGSRLQAEGPSNST
uniref:Uncharacterized protein n=1 Tax=Mustela putorius furo TaxID=9669 RepID=M3YSE7_MUSPF